MGDGAGITRGNGDRLFGIRRACDRRRVTCDSRLG